MSSGRKWIKRIIWTLLCLVVVGGTSTGIVFHMLRGTPDWYQPDTSTDDQKRSAADRVENVLAEIREKLIRPKRPNRAQELARANEQSAAQAEKVRNEQADAPFELELTDAQLNAFFAKWQNQARQQLLGEYVEDPRVVVRNKQLILVGKVKSMGIILSLIFEPHLDDHGGLFMNLVRVQGGMLSVPDAAWSGKRDSIEQVLAKKLPAFQDKAETTPEGFVNGDAGSASINEMLLAVLRGTSSPAVIFVPVESYALAPSIPVKINAMTMEGHSIKMTVQKMTGGEQKKFLQAVKSFDPQTGNDKGDQPKPE